MVNTSIAPSRQTLVGRKVEGPRSEANNPRPANTGSASYLVHMIMVSPYEYPYNDVTMFFWRASIETDLGLLPSRYGRSQATSIDAGIVES